MGVLLGWDVGCNTVVVPESTPIFEPLQVAGSGRRVERSAPLSPVRRGTDKYLDAVAGAGRIVVELGDNHIGVLEERVVTRP